MRSLFFLVLLSLSLSLTSCGPSRFVRPIREGETAMQISSGMWPITGLETGSSEEGLVSILAMLGGSSLCAGYGINQELTGWGAIYPVFMLGGVFAGEIGAVGGLVQPVNQGFGLSVSPRMHVLFGFGDGIFNSSSEVTRFSAVPQVDITAYHESRTARPYLGISGYLPFASIRDEFRTFTTLVPSVNLGIALKAREREFSIELKGLIFEGVDNESLGLRAIAIGVSMMWL